MRLSCVRQGDAPRRHQPGPSTTLPAATRSCLIFRPAPASVGLPHYGTAPGLPCLAIFSDRGHGQCFAAFLTFLPLCLTLPASFLVLPLAAFASRFAFLATPMTGSSSPPDMPRSGGCQLPRWTQLKPGGGRDLFEYIARAWCPRLA